MKILILKTSALGDIIHTFPVLSYLRSRFPLGQLDWAVEEPFAELVARHPDVNQVLTIDSKKWRKRWLDSWHEMGAFRRTLREVEYDLVFDLQGNVKSSAILTQTRAKTKIGFGWKTVAEWPNALFTSRKINPPTGNNIREDYLAVVQGYFDDQTQFEVNPVELCINTAEQALVDSVLSNAVLVCPGSAWANKQLSEELLVSFLKKQGEGPYLFAWGREKEREMASNLAAYFPTSMVLARYSLPVLQHVMAKCRLVVAMDSLPLHLCATTGTPTISFFGPSLAKKYGPIGIQHQTFQGVCPYNITFEKRCPQLRTCKTGACLKKPNILL